MADAQMDSSDGDPTQRLLKNAGLENSPIDPASLQALREYVSSAVRNNETDSTQPPLDQVSARDPSLQRFVSDLTEPVGLSSTTAAGAGGDVASSATTAGSSDQHDGMTKEERILKLLEKQTALIMDLHRRVDELNTTVQGMQQQSPPASPVWIGQGIWRNNNAAAAGGGERMMDLPRQQQQQQQQQGGRRQARAARELPEPRQIIPPPQQQPTAQQPPQQQQREAIPVVTQLMNRIRALSETIRSTRLAKIVQLFLALRRRQVRNLNGGLMIKVLIMLAIVASRLARRSRAAADDLGWMYKFHALAILVVAGFLIQSGYAQFAYRFFVKYNYPARIWEGEEIDVETVLREEAERQRQQPRAAAAAAQAAADPAAAARQRQAPEPGVDAVGGWRQTLLGGRIAPNDPENQAPGPLRLIQDVIFLFGSFFLSIFPIWRPEPIQRHEMPPLEQAQPEPEQQAGEEEEEPDQLPRVRPPGDPVEVEDADSDDD